jgi:large subunit ribosomal protein L11
MVTVFGRSTPRGARLHPGGKALTRPIASLQRCRTVSFPPYKAAVAGIRRNPSQERKDMAKKVTGYIKLQLPAGAATPAPPGGPRPGPARRQHHGIRQAVQREVRDRRREGHHPAGGHHRLRRPQLQLRPQDPPAAVLIKKKLGLDKGSAGPQQAEGGQDHPGPADRDRQGQDARPQRRQLGRRRALHRRLRPLHGRRSRQLI